MFYAGRRWRVTDTPTRIRESIWTAPLQDHRGLYGWRFQATDEQGESFVFDVYRSETRLARAPHVQLIRARPARRSGREYDDSRPLLLRWVSGQPRCRRTRPVLLSAP